MQCGADQARPIANRADDLEGQNGDIIVQSATDRALDALLRVREFFRIDALRLPIRGKLAEVCGHDGPQLDGRGARQRSRVALQDLEAANQQEVACGIVLAVEQSLPEYDLR